MVVVDSFCRVLLLFPCFNSFVSLIAVVESDRCVSRLINLFVLLILTAVVVCLFQSLNSITMHNGSKIAEVSIPLCTKRDEMFLVAF